MVGAAEKDTKFELDGDLKVDIVVKTDLEKLETKVKDLIPVEEIVRVKDPVEQSVGLGETELVRVFEPTGEIV